MTAPKTDKQKLWDSWGYSFEGWIRKLESVPVKLVKQKDFSEAYTMDRAEVFKLENGSYALVKESGCSCYDSTTDAKIELFPNLLRVKKAYNDWVKGHESEYSPRYTTEDLL